MDKKKINKILKINNVHTFSIITMYLVDLDNKYDIKIINMKIDVTIYKLFIG